MIRAKNVTLKDVNCNFENAQTRDTQIAHKMESNDRRKNYFWTLSLTLLIASIYQST